MRMNVFWTYWRQFLSKKESFKTLALMEKFMSGREARDRRILPKANTTDQLFHRHSSDLAIGGESL
jgi:hypothetical protein